MIRSFQDRDTESLFVNGSSLRFQQCARQAFQKLRMVDAAARLEDLRVPPGNRLEALRGRRAGQWSIRVNDQYRICFRWREGGAEEVELTDYH